MERSMSGTDSKPSTASASLPQQAGRLALFGPPPLLEGEDTAAYDDLLVRISGAVKPADIFEEIWVRDIVDLVWEAFRLRRFKANLMTAVAHVALEDILEPLMDWTEAHDLAEAWAARERAAIERVDELLASAGLTMDAVMARTLSLKLNGGWAGTAEIAGAVIAPDSLVVDSNVKKVQHPTGGIVGELLVRDGDQVKSGDLVVRLDETITRANLAIVLKSLDELTAREARF
jgi:biotin carboxyl carrier protein